MTESSVPDRRTISNVVLTLAVVGGLILSYFLAIPFLPAIVWSVTLGVLFAPLDARLRRSIRSATISAAATVAIVAFIVVVPGILVVGSLLNEAAKSVTVISPMLEADHWAHLLDNHPRLAPALRWINERLDLPDLIQTAVSWIAARSGPIVRASFLGRDKSAFDLLFLVLHSSRSGKGGRVGDEFGGEKPVCARYGSKRQSLIDQARHRSCR